MSAKAIHINHNRVLVHSSVSCDVMSLISPGHPRAGCSWQRADQALPVEWPPRPSRRSQLSSHYQLLKCEWLGLKNSLIMLFNSRHKFSSVLSTDWWVPRSSASHTSSDPVRTAFQVEVSQDETESCQRVVCGGISATRPWQTALHHAGCPGRDPPSTVKPEDEKISSGLLQIEKGVRIWTFFMIQEIPAYPMDRNRS